MPRRCGASELNARTADVHAPSTALRGWRNWTHRSEARQVPPSHPRPLQTIDWFELSLALLGIAALVVSVRGVGSWCRFVESAHVVEGVAATAIAPPRPAENAASSRRWSEADAGLSLVVILSE